MQRSQAFTRRSSNPENFQMGLVLLVMLALLGTETIPTFAQGQQTPDPAAVETQVKHWGVG